jgi:microcystin degradation protein MlrC
MFPENAPRPIPTTSQTAPLRNLGLDISAFQVIAIKSRVHFMRGFHDNGFARTILLVEP